MKTLLTRARVTTITTTSILLLFYLNRKPKEEISLLTYAREEELKSDAVRMPGCICSPFWLGFISGFPRNFQQGAHEFICPYFQSLAA